MSDKRILVIDDDDAVRDSLHVILSCAGYDVTTADCGDTGIAEFRTLRPDLVVTDIMMPDKDGIETIREIRDIDPDAKILAVSGHMRGLSVNFLDTIRHLGADAALAKPFDSDEFLATVEACLEPPRSLA